MNTTHRTLNTWCIDCRLPYPWCICLSSTLESAIDFTFLLSNKESRKKTNTGLIAAKTLARSKVYYPGKTQQPLKTSDLVNFKRTTAILFPGGRPVAEFRHTPISVIVPDSSWSHARKMALKLKYHTSLPFISLSPSTPSQFVISRGRPNISALCTIEAVACLLMEYGERENGQTVYELFLKLMQGMRIRARSGGFAEENLCC